MIFYFTMVTIRLFGDQSSDLAPHVEMSLDFQLIAKSLEVRVHVRADGYIE